VDRNVQLEFPSDPRLLRAVRGLVRGYAENLGYSEDRVSEVVLAVDEACANAIRHSYRGATDGELALSLSSNEHGVEIVLRDKGQPATAERLREQALRAHADPVSDIPLRPGGLGVRIMYQAFDEVVFRPGKRRGNCVTMRLKPPSEG